jgi:hypothetical protein
MIPFPIAAPTGDVSSLMVGGIHLFCLMTHFVAGRPIQSIFHLLIVSVIFYSARIWPFELFDSELILLCVVRPMKRHRPITRPANTETQIHSRSSLYKDFHFEVSLLPNVLRSPYPPLCSSSERELARSKPYEEHGTHANENAKDTTSPSPSGSKSKSKAVPLHALEALGGRGGIAPTHSRPRD